ncbi:hypothetical protein [Dechloromonas denitrificans]|uniref:hypothetical protein n=1 Tax=Dechloromonas denitrificans TaxID=281362 RepID=UPI001CFAAD7F|nr:hypothetical protein [Dechloromonas denitrificans]UCV07204.1 hypothetical protein KI615_17635 [Dechloromonas denitrificans]
MVIVTEESDLPSITNPAIRSLVTLRFQQFALNAPASPNTSPGGYFIMVEGGDAISKIEQAAGFPILTSLFDNLPFGHPDFYPCTEILEEHRNDNTCIYEMVFIGNDDGAFTAIFVPDEEGIDADLLAMCRSFATPAMSTPP